MSNSVGHRTVWKLAAILGITVWYLALGVGIWAGLEPFTIFKRASVTGIVAGLLSGLWLRLCQR